VQPNDSDIELLSSVLVVVVVLVVRIVIVVVCCYCRRQCMVVVAWSGDRQLISSETQWQWNWAGEQCWVVIIS